MIGAVSDPTEVIKDSIGQATVLEQESGQPTTFYLNPGQVLGPSPINLKSAANGTGVVACWTFAKDSEHTY